MARPKQSEQHPNLEVAIKKTARKQIAKKGAAALSLRAIARELHITAPAIYNYFPNRDALVTALIVDAYNALRDAIRASLVVNETSHAERILASARAYRGWALAHPEEYNLIFGTPIPNYSAPAEVTDQAAADAMTVLIDALDAAWRTGVLKTEGAFTAEPEMIRAWVDKFGYRGDPAVIHFVLASWAHIHGLVSLELYGHFSAVAEPDTVDAFFETEIRAMLVRMGVL